MFPSIIGTLPADDNPGFGGSGDASPGRPMKQGSCLPSPLWGEGSGVRGQVATTSPLTPTFSPEGRGSNQRDRWPIFEIAQ